MAQNPWSDRRPLSVRRFLTEAREAYGPFDAQLLLLAGAFALGIVAVILAIPVIFQ